MLNGVADVLEDVPKSKESGEITTFISGSKVFLIVEHGYLHVMLDNSGNKMV